MRKPSAVLVGLVSLLGCRLVTQGSGPELDASSADVGDMDTSDAEGLPPCANSARDGLETDIDCGGGECQKCANGRDCLVASDCLSGSCRTGKCTPPDTCTNGSLDGDETDVDCGGSCAKCAVGRSCKAPKDCLSATCIGGVCKTPSCSDGVVNGDESDVDCGGSCPPCALERQCAKPSDCTTGYCDVTFCRWPRTCRQLKLALPKSASGPYTLDPDASGPIAPFSAYCEMDYDGGGWTYFAHQDSEQVSGRLFDGTYGSYQVSRADGGSSYSIGGYLLPKLDHTAVFVSLDDPDPVKSIAAKKFIEYRYPAKTTAFTTGPIPCTGPVPIEYRLFATDTVKAATIGPCDSGKWYALRVTDSRLLVLFHSTESGNFWGSGVGGDDSWGHDGYWYVR